MNRLLPGNKNRFWVYLFIVFQCLWGNSLRADSDCTLAVGWEPWHPYQYIDDNGQLTGFDIEFLSEIANQMMCQLDYKEINWARGVVEIESGELDLLAGANFTAERSRWAHFSEPYKSSRVVLYVRQGESAKYLFQSLQDIIGSNFRLGVGRGVVYNDEFLALLERPEFEKQLVYIPTAELQQYQMLQANRVDGFLRSITLLESLPEKVTSDLKLEIHPLDVSSSRLHVMFSKQSVSSDTVKRFNTALRAMRESGLLETLIDRYF